MAAVLRLQTPRPPSKILLERRRVGFEDARQPDARLILDLTNRMEGSDVARQLIPGFDDFDHDHDPTESIQVENLSCTSAACLYTRHHIQATFNLMGCKPVHSAAMTARLFDRVHTEHGEALVSRTDFVDLVREALASESYTSRAQLTDFQVASEIKEHKHSFILLLGGTSGTGKSTLASLLASRLGMSRVLSTDSIRHLLRSRTRQETNPCLFASTYQAGELHVSEEEVRASWYSGAGGGAAADAAAVPPGAWAQGGAEAPPDTLPRLSALVPPLRSMDKPPSAKRVHKRRVLQGVRRQSEPVIELLDKILGSFEAQGHSVVVEGVHLSVESMVELCRRHPSAVPILIFISNENKHYERFAVRSPHMALNPAENKYLKYFDNIRIIQKRLQKAADFFLVPRVDNTNVDRSLATIHSTIVRVLRRMVVDGEPVLDPVLGKTVLVSRAFESTYQKAWSSKAMRKLLRQKVSKRLLLGRFLTDVTAEAMDEMATDGREGGANAHHSADHYAFGEAPPGGSTAHFGGGAVRDREAEPPDVDEEHRTQQLLDYSSSSSSHASSDNEDEHALERSGTGGGAAVGWPVPADSEHRSSPRTEEGDHSAHGDGSAIGSVSSAAVLAASALASVQLTPEQRPMPSATHPSEMEGFALSSEDGHSEVSEDRQSVGT